MLGADERLTDALNDFDKIEVSHAAIKTDSPSPASSSSTGNLPENAQGGANGPTGGLPSGAPSSEAEMTQQFAAKMRDLLKDVSGDADLLKLLDEMVPDKSSADSAQPGAASSSSTSSPTPPMAEDELQKKINEALEALNQSADKAVRCFSPSFNLTMFLIYSDSLRAPRRECRTWKSYSKSLRTIQRCLVRELAIFCSRSGFI